MAISPDKTTQNESIDLEPTVASFRRFHTRPSGIFVDNVASHIKQTGQPETFDGLYHGRLPRDAKYLILRKIEIDGRKRPNGDMAPCPMCTPNRFLSGALVWLNELQCVAVIGHCCAEHANEAEREFKLAEEKRQEEDYLLVTLPFLGEKKVTIDKLRPTAVEALRVYRRFRKGCSRLQQHLRHLNKQGGGRLYIVEVLRSKEDDDDREYFGPAGFRGRGGSEVETRDHDLGRITGTTALLSDYNPLAELDNLARVISSFEFTSGEEKAIDFIVSMTFKQRRAAVAIMQEIDRGYVKFIRRLLDFLIFFDRKNIELLHRYGNHPLNNFIFDARYETWHGQPKVRFLYNGQETALIIGIDIDRLNFRWEVPSVKK